MLPLSLSWGNNSCFNKIKSYKSIRGMYLYTFGLLLEIDIQEHMNITDTSLLYNDSDYIYIILKTGI